MLSGIAKNSSTVAGLTRFLAACKAGLFFLFFVCLRLVWRFMSSSSRTVLHRTSALAYSFPLKKTSTKIKMGMLAYFGTSYYLMGKRGPKPANMGLLSTWEFEFFKAFHLLRDGTQLPMKQGPPTELTKAENRSFIERLRRMTPDEYLLTTRRLAVLFDFGEREHLRRPPNPVERWWAEEQRDQEIRSLQTRLRGYFIRAAEARRKIWADLIRADTYAALHKVCGRWARLPDVRRTGLTPFPGHVLENAAQFLAMKRNKRFPRSTYGDDSRIEYLARGMAGALCGLSPMTAIERLRNMKHIAGGPFWITYYGNRPLGESERHCGCWRCSIRKSGEISKMGQKWYENGLKAFIEMAHTTKVPSEWKTPRFKSL
jgi:hypothetical protein